MKIALVLSYLGSRYHGWQRQANGMTIQELLETAIAKTCGVEAAVSGCGRTDAGVHAAMYVASVRLETGIPLERLPAALGSRLPHDVVVHRAVAVPDSFDARFSCVSKEYTYLYLSQPTRDPFLSGRAWFYPHRLDTEAMDTAARYLLGRQDFAALMSAGSPVKSTVRTIHYARVAREGARVTLRVRADGFLYNMVRTIAGTLAYVGSGKLAPEAMADILAGGRREAAGPTAPPWGLYLTALTYSRQPGDILEALDGQRSI